MQRYASGILLQNLFQGNNLFLGTLRCVRIAEKVHGFEVHTSFCHEPAGNRRIYSAGQKQRAFPGHTGRQTACAVYAVAVYERIIFAYVYIHNQIGVVYVYFQVPEFAEYEAARFRSDFGRFKRKRFIGTLGFGFEGVRIFQRIRELVFYHGINAFHVFECYICRAYFRYSEYLFRTFNGFRHACGFVERLNIESRLCFPYFIFSFVFQTVTDIVQQLFLKILSVMTL